MLNKPSCISSLPPLPSPNHTPVSDHRISTIGSGSLPTQWQMCPILGVKFKTCEAVSGNSDISTFVHKNKSEPIQLSETGCTGVGMVKETFDWCISATAVLKPFTLLLPYLRKSQPVCTVSNGTTVHINTLLSQSHHLKIIHLLTCPCQTFLQAFFHMGHS